MRHDWLKDEVRRPIDAYGSRVNAAGIRGFNALSMDVFPNALMRRSTDQNIATGGIGVKVTFDTRIKDSTYEEAFQQLGRETCDLTNDYLIIRVPGWYRVWAKVPFSAVAAAGQRTGYFQLDTGGGFAAMMDSNVTIPGANGVVTSLLVEAQAQLDAGHKIELWAAQTSGLTIALDNTLGISLGANWLGL